MPRFTDNNARERRFRAGLWRFFILLLLYAAALYGIGLLVIGSNADAHPKTVMRWCAPKNQKVPYPHIAHSLYGCKFPNMWVRVPWWIGQVV